MCTGRELVLQLVKSITGRGVWAAAAAAAASDRETDLRLILSADHLRPPSGSVYCILVAGYLCNWYIYFYQDIVKPVLL